MRKNVFRNFDFVVCQTDKMEAIQKMFQSAYFVRFLPFIDSFFLRYYFERDIDCWKKIIISQKWRWCCHRYSFRNGIIPEPPDPMRTFHFYIAKSFPPRRFTTPTQKTRISVTFCRFGAFPDLWRHPMVALFCVCVNFTYRSNETFCSRTHRFG